MIFSCITCTNDKIQSKSTFNYYVFLDNPLENIFVMNYSSLYSVKMSFSLAVFTLSLKMITHGSKLKTKNYPKSIRISHFRSEIKLSLDVFRIKLIYFNFCWEVLAQIKIQKVYTGSIQCWIYVIVMTYEFWWKVIKFRERFQHILVNLIK